MSLWRAIVTAYTKRKEVSISFKDGKKVDGIVVWYEGSNDSESERDEAAIETNGGKTLFFFVDEVENVYGRRKDNEEALEGTT